MHTSIAFALLAVAFVILVIVLVMALSSLK